MPFFSEADPIFVSAIITKLRFEVFLEGDVIIQEGTIGADMYFLREGSVEIRTNNDLQNVLNDGSYFGGKGRFPLRKISMGSDRIGTELKPRMGFRYQFSVPV